MREVPDGGRCLLKAGGAARLPASPEAVREALADAGLLVRAVPWLDQLDAGVRGRHQFLATTAVAAISGSYAGEAVVTEPADPGQVVLRVSAAGARGKVTADVTIGLGPAGDDGTELSYAVDADVEGAIAGIGQLMLAGIARRLAADAIGGLEAALAGAGQADAAQPDPAQPDPVPAGVPAAGPALTGPAADQTAVERARRGIGLGGERVPAAGETVITLGPAALAGAVAGVAAVVFGAILVRRRRAGRR